MKRFLPAIICIFALSSAGFGQSKVSDSTWARRASTRYEISGLERNHHRRLTRVEIALRTYLICLSAFERHQVLARKSDALELEVASWQKVKDLGGMTPDESKAFDERMTKSIRLKIKDMKALIHGLLGGPGSDFSEDLRRIRKVVKEYRSEFGLLNINPEKMLEQVREIRSRMDVF